MMSDKAEWRRVVGAFGIGLFGPAVASLLVFELTPLPIFKSSVLGLGVFAVAIALWVLPELAKGGAADV